MGFKSKFSRLTEKLKLANEEIERLIDKNIIAERSIQQFTEEKEIMKLRMATIIKKNGKFNPHNKVCKKCS